MTWKSKKQPVVAQSSAEPELRSVAHGVNKVAIDITYNPVHHDHIKHVEVDRHFIKEKIDEGTINIAYVHTLERTTDILTKGLFRTLFEKFVDKIRLYNWYTPA